MEIIHDFKFPRRFWAVGAYFNETSLDKSNEFFINKIWFDGWAEINKDLRDKPLLDSVQDNDVFVLKSKATKNKTEPFTRLKAIGIVSERKSISTFAVNWHKGIRFPIDFDGILYMKTIEEMRNDELLKFVKTFIEKLKL